MECGACTALVACDPGGHTGGGGGGGGVGSCDGLESRTFSDTMTVKRKCSAM